MPRFEARADRAPERMPSAITRSTAGPGVMDSTVSVIRKNSQRSKRIGRIAGGVPSGNGAELSRLDGAAKVLRGREAVDLEDPGPRGRGLAHEGGLVRSEKARRDGL